MFADRVDAGRRLAKELTRFAAENVVVVGLPRGGVPVAAEIADTLNAPLDIIVVRKLGVPFQPELAMGAVGEGGASVVEDDVVRLTRVSAQTLAKAEERERAVVEQRARRLRGDRLAEPLTGRTVIIVDDGIATGSTARAACQVARRQGAARVVLAAPVGPPGVQRRLRPDADEVVCLETPSGFFAIGQCYANFAPTSEEEVSRLLRSARERMTGRRPAFSTVDLRHRDEEVAVRAGTAVVGGHLTVPDLATGIVVFAHGSGSSRRSPRNQRVAAQLNDARLATLLFDLLTVEEETDRANVFDVELLGHRLLDVTRWLRGQPGVAELPVGFFGASTGAGAALWAAADPDCDVTAIVSRGGRPDLAGARLSAVRAPTLLIVGGRDTVVIELNRRAQAHLTGESRLDIVRGATHLFEEPGTLDMVGRLAADWFTTHLAPCTAAPSRRPAGPSALARRTSRTDGEVMRALLRAFGAVAIDDDPRWTLCFTDRHPLHARVQETLLMVGDGVVGLRGSHEEGDPHEAPLVVASGVYGGDGPAEHLIAGPSPLALCVTDGDTGQRRVLDLRTGVLWRDEPDAAAPVRTMRFVAAGRRGIVAMRAEGPAGRLSPGTPLRQLTDRTMTSGHLDDVTWARTVGDRGGIAAAATQTVVTHDGHRVIERIAAYTPEYRRPPPVGRAVAALNTARRRGFDGLFTDHCDEWTRRWSDACVEIPDDADAEFAARYALFQLWCNVADRGEAAVGARGLSGTGYAGHVFWDADVFVLPAIASMSPAAARAMLEYRIRRLPQARSIARLRGLDGVRFPWESASIGVDVTPTSGRANGEWVPIFTGQLEEHINADIAWAACHYAAWADDPAFLAGDGRPLVTETARYFASRAHMDDDGTAHIRHVIGPDEYHEDVDDNAYTNILARWNLRRAAALEGTTPEAANWSRFADALVDGHDATTGRHEQFTGYYRLEPLTMADVGTPPLAADLLLGSARTSAAQIIKQPDVLMAHHLLPAELPAGSLAADLDFYLPRTAHGSSLSPAITAALLAKAGRPDDALRYLDIALRIDLDDLTGMTGAGLHLATLAGVWQALLFGFAGVAVHDNAVTINPQLPRRWGSLNLRFRCLRRRVELSMTNDTTMVTASGPLQVRTPGGEVVGVAHHRLRLVNTDTGWVVDPSCQ